MDTLRALCSFLLMTAVSLALAPTPAAAQATGATVRGRVLLEDQPVAAGTPVVATNADNGAVRRAATQADGGYVLVDLDPGTYEIRIAADGREQVVGPVRVLIGQTMVLDVTVGAPAQPVEEVVVTGQRLIEIRTAEIATNVTLEQIESLPQSTRNFLNFAALAPGVRVNDGDTAKTFQSGALSANSVNVYIDGTSYKNQVLTGGVAGQDSSRGNPFPQNAVREFRVATQNFNAEYEHAAGAIITTLTRSGTNELESDGFVYFQDKGLVAVDDFAEPGQPRAEYERLQYGLSVSGPIIRDKMHFFVAFEGNDQDRANRVTLGNPAFEPEFGQFEGSFAQPFRQDLFFGKIDYRPSDAHALELSVNYRDESDIKDFGGQTAYQAANDVQNTVRTGRLAYTYDAESWVNEASLSYLDYAWHPTPLNPGLVGLDFRGVVRVGGADTAQDIGQNVLTFKDDVTFTELGNGRHVLKTGLLVASVEFDVQKRLSGNPLFGFLPEVSFDFPGEAAYGTGNPDLSNDTTQYGLYLQDDWQVTDRLDLSLGVRWDYDSNFLNDDYVTPPEVVAAVAGLVPGQYVTDGDDREAPDDLFQPRLGFTFDLSGDERMVLFGGIGRYYDRILYNETLDERLRLQWQVRRFMFSADGAPRDGQPTIVWNDAFLSREGLDGLIASGVAPNPEIFLIENDTRVPVTDQASLGVRRRFGDDWIGSLALARNRSRHGFSYVLGNLNPDGTCCAPIPGNFSSLLLSTDDKQAWYDGVYITLDKPYTEGERWGMTLAYTYSEAEENGGDLFSLDFPTIADYPRHPTSADERNRLVFTAIVGLKWDLKLSTLVTLGSGTGYTIVDQSLGTGPGEIRRGYYSGRPEKESFIVPDAWAYRSVDLRLAKTLPFAGRRLGVVVEALNIFDYENYAPGSYNGIIPAPGEPPNEAFGLPTALIEPGRRLQLGVTFGF